MEFKKELAKLGYNKGDSIDVETLTDEILPELFSKKMYSEEEVIQLLIKFNQEIQEIEDVRIWFHQFKKK